MFRVRALTVFAAAAVLAGCGAVAGGTVPTAQRDPQTLRAVPIVSPSPAARAPQTLRAVPIESPTPAPKSPDTLRAVPIVSPTPAP